MPSKKKPTRLQTEYQKEYNNYLKRIESARQAGYVIPDELLKIKKEKPRTRDIETLKKITRKTIREKTITGKVGFVNPETGEVLEKRQAFAKSYQRRKPTPNLEKPTTFEESMDIISVINDYIQKYNPPESSKKHLIDTFIEREMKSRRGSDFDYEKFKKAEEKNGWLFKNPNRPLEGEEIEYLQNLYDEGITDRPIGAEIEEIRAWNSDFNYYDKYFENQINETGKAPHNIIDDHKIDQYYNTQKESFVTGERPTEQKRKKSDVGQETIEAINLNNLRERLNGVEIKGVWSKNRYSNERKQTAQTNRYKLNAFLDRAIDEYGIKAVDKAIAKANSIGHAFQIWFLYHDEAMGFYMSELENYLMDFGLDYEQAENYDNSFETGDDYEEY